MLRKEKSSPQTFGENAHEELSNKKCDMRGGLTPQQAGRLPRGKSKFFGYFPKGGGIVGENGRRGKQKTGKKKEYSF